MRLLFIVVLFGHLCLADSLIIKQGTNCSYMGLIDNATGNGRRTNPGYYSLMFVLRHCSQFDRACYSNSSTSSGANVLTTTDTAMSILSLVNNISPLEIIFHDITSFSVFHSSI